MERRNFLALMGTTAFAALTQHMGLPTASDDSKADIELHISPVEIEVAARKMIKTTGYNGSAPGLGAPWNNLFEQSGARDPVAGMMTATSGTSRQIQFGLKILF